MNRNVFNKSLCPGGRLLTAWQIQLDTPKFSHLKQHHTATITQPLCWIFLLPYEIWDYTATHSSGVVPFVRSGKQHYLSPVHMGVSTEYGALRPGCKGIWAWAVHAILLPMKAIPFGPKNKLLHVVVQAAYATQHNTTQYSKSHVISTQSRLVYIIERCRVQLSINQDELFLNEKSSESEGRGWFFVQK